MKHRGWFRKLAPIAAALSAMAAADAASAVMPDEGSGSDTPAAGLIAAESGARSRSRDALFEDDEDTAAINEPTADVATGSPGLRGYWQFELARTVADPEHWTKMRTRAEIGSQGMLGDGIKWKLSARLDYDAVYDYHNFYPREVERDQRFGLTLRENYLDFNTKGWDFRIGRQHVVWGEMVGVFVADVVSAKDMREFILPDFDVLRIPQWAARGEYFGDDYHVELLWIPVPSYDRIGKPGSEFYPVQPVPPGAVSLYRQEARPERKLAHTNYGARFSMLRKGWDASVFYYRSMDNAPTFYREIRAPATFVFEPRHDRITQMGGTVAKDFGSVVFKAEAVHTRGRQFPVLRFTDPDGVVPQDTIDWIAGLDFSLPADTRFNVQVFQRLYRDHDPDILAKKQESGYTLYLNSPLADRLEAELLLIASLERTDWLFRPKLIWAFENNWRAVFGADVFKGPPAGLFGQYDRRDRVYTEIRYSF